MAARGVVVTKFSVRLALSGLLAAAASGATPAATVERSVFGILDNGVPVDAVVLRNSRGILARIISYGATLQALEVPDRDGRSADVVLGYDDLEGYVRRPNYFGATIGRFANRIAGGAFMLNGKRYELTRNDKGNSLHGGSLGFDKQVWRLQDLHQGSTASATFALTSPAGDQGYPGRLEVRTTYALDESGNLSIDYTATTDAPTVVNLTNHALFNLAGEGAEEGVLGHRLVLPASHYTPVDASLIPTGELRSVTGTVFDFTGGRRIGDGIRDGRDPQIAAGRGYDHNFALDARLTKEPKLAARLEDARSGRVLEVWSTEPGVQVYTGNFLDGTLLGKRGHLYRMGDGIALEPQKFPNAPNEPRFTSARVDPDKPYHHRMIFRLSTMH